MGSSSDETAVAADPLLPETSSLQRRRNDCPCCAFEFDLFLPPSSEHISSAIDNDGGDEASSTVGTTELLSISQVASVLAAAAATNDDNSNNPILIIDTHGHAQLNRDRDPTYDLSINNDDMTTFKRIHLQSLACAVEPADFERTLEYASASTSILPALGVHPWYIIESGVHLTDNNDDWLIRLEDLLRRHPAALVGEIGLCKIARWVRSYPEGKAAAMQIQKQVLKQQLRLAAKLQRPVSVHCVSAHGLFVTTIQELMTEQVEGGAAAAIPPAIAMHSFTGTAHHVKELLDLETTIRQRRRQGKKTNKRREEQNTPLFYFGFSHAVNYAMCSSDKSRRKGMEAVKAVPLDRLLVESDVHHHDDVLGGTLGAIAYVARARREANIVDLAASTTRNAQRFLAHTSHDASHTSSRCSEIPSTGARTLASSATDAERSTLTRNVIIMSEAGKPIFSLYGSPDEVSQLCSLVQALRTSTHSLGMGDVQFLIADKLRVAVLTVGSITLVRLESTMDTANQSSATTEAFACLELEYVYSQLISALSDHVQTVLQHNPSLDVRSTMMDITTENMLRRVLTQTSNSVGKYLVEAFPLVSPLSFELRHHASKVLLSVTDKPENNVAFAMLVAGDDHDMVTLVQPAHRSHQLRASDWHAMVTFFGKQKEFISTNNTELWIPICLPRFHSSGFLYAYTKCFHVPTKLALVLLTPLGTTEQFEIARRASQRIQKELHLPTNPESILTVVEKSASSIDATLQGSSSTSMDSVAEDDYVQISVDMVQKGLPDGESYSNLLTQLHDAQEISTVESICKRYLKDAEEQPKQFVFRLDVPIKSPSGLGHLSQCIVASLKRERLEDKVREQKMWTNYQKLSLRLRLGSASIEAAMDAFDMIDDSCKNRSDESATGTNTQPGSFPGIGENCAAIGLFESPAYATDGLSYIIDGDKMYLGMNGNDFEL